MIVRRQRGQALGLASVGIVAMVGMLAFVIDAGNFFVIRRELQNIADTAALAGAETLDPELASRWNTSGLLPSADCPTPPGPPVSNATTLTIRMVCTYVKRNSPVARSLCGTDPVVEELTISGWPIAGGSPTPNVFVRVRCYAGYSFGRILNLQSRTMKAQATAALGRSDGAGHIIDYQPLAPWPAPNDLTARLIAD